MQLAVVEVLATLMVRPVGILTFVIAHLIVDRLVVVPL